METVLSLLTAGNLKGAGLSVHGVELQVHGTGEGQRNPAQFGE